MRAFKSLQEFLVLKGAYRRAFSSAEGQMVLRDLAAVCHAASTTADANTHEQARKEGKRQVWLRIQNMLHMTDAEVYNHAKEDQNV